MPPAEAPLSPPRPPIDCSAPARPPALRLSAIAEVDGKLAALLPGDTLASGHRLRLTVTAPRARFVGLVRRDPRGALEWLVPLRALEADRPVDLPEGSWLELDDEVGVESLLVVASDTPFAGGEGVPPEVGSAVRQAMALGAGARAQEASSALRAFEHALVRHRRAHAAVLRARGLELFASDTRELATLAVGDDDSPLVAMPFEIRHVAKGTAPDLALSADPGAIKLGASVFRDGQGAFGASRAAVPEEATTSVRQLACRLRSFAPRSAALVYAHDGEALRTFLVDEDGLLAHARVPVSEEELARRVTALRLSLLIPAVGPERGTKLTHLANLSSVPDARFAARDALAVALPPPVASALATVRHLTVVPTLSLGALPFAALQPFGAERHLVDEMSITVAPSLRDLWLEVEPWRFAPTHPLIVGDPQLLLPELGFEQLAGAAAEARSVAHKLAATALLGAEATKAAFLERLVDADFVYLASHALTDDVDPLRSSFLLLSGDRSGWLTPWELMSRFAESPLRAQLVVLSACQTALGGYHAGGVVGLARAFQLGGAPRVVMSQWSVADEPTALLMDLFTDELRSTFPSEALRRAMVKMRRRHPSPALWAPFTVFGLPR